MSTQDSSLVSRLKAQGRWTAPPKGVSETQWAYALCFGITERYKPVPAERLEGLMAEKAKK